MIQIGSFKIFGPENGLKVLLIIIDKIDVIKCKYIVIEKECLSLHFYFQH
jgi:hypothetical protein